MERQSLLQLCAFTRIASNRQLKRIRNHPKNYKLRMKEMEALGINPFEKKIEPLKYTPTYVPETVGYRYWSPAPEKPIDGLPFTVKRTVKGLQLPVYSDIRKGNTQHWTILRRFEGDVDELANELSKVCDGNSVVHRPGHLEVKGKHNEKVKKWLVGLGF